MQDTFVFKHVFQIHLKTAILGITFVNSRNCLGHLVYFCALSYEKSGTLALLQELK